MARCTQDRVKQLDAIDAQHWKLAKLTLEIDAELQLVPQPFEELTEELDEVLREYDAMLASSRGEERQKNLKNLTLLRAFSPYLDHYYQ